MTRRRFLAGCCGLAAAGLGGALLLRRRHAPTMATRLLALLGAEAIAGTTATRYLELFPAEASADALAAALAADLGWRARFAGRERLGQLVTALMREDFRAGRTVVLEGWTFSRTGARMSALVALVRPPAVAQPSASAKP